MALKAALAMPLSASAAQGQMSASSEQELADLVRKTEARASAFMRGDMDKWASLTRIADDFTLMQPFGGEASRGFDMSPERLAKLASYFRNGDAKVELVQSYVSADLVVREQHLGVRRIGGRLCLGREGGRDGAPYRPPSSGRQRPKRGER